MIENLDELDPLILKQCHTTESHYQLNGIVIGFKSSSELEALFVAIATPRDLKKAYLIFQSNYL